MAKAATVLVGIDVLAIMIAPSTAKKMRGIPTSPTLDFRSQFINYYSAAHILSAACLLFVGSSVNTAVGSGLLLSTISIGKAILTGESKKVGLPVVGLYIAGIINTVVACSLLRNVNVATDLIKYFSLWSGVNGLGLMVMPLTVNSIWGFVPPDVREERAIAFFNRFLGGTILSASVFCASLAFGVDAAKAIGYGLIPALVSTLVTNFVTKEVQAVGLIQGPQFISIAMIAAFIIALIL